MILAGRSSDLKTVAFLESQIFHKIVRATEGQILSDGLIDLWQYGYHCLMISSVLRKRMNKNILKWLVFFFLYRSVCFLFEDDLYYFLCNTWLELLFWDGMHDWSLVKPGRVVWNNGFAICFIVIWAPLRYVSSSSGLLRKVTNILQDGSNIL